MASLIDVNNEFGGEMELADLTVVVEDHKISVSKSVLCIASPVFYAMLKGDFQEKTKTEIPLPGKNYEDFVEFLRCIYPDRLKKVTAKNVYQVLPLAHEYQVKRILKRCEKVICKIVRENHLNDVPELYRHIQLAETFALDDLKEISTYIVSEHKLEDFEKAQEKYQISDGSHLKVIKLALRRSELNSEDEMYFSLNINGKVVRQAANQSSSPFIFANNNDFRVANQSSSPSIFANNNDFRVILTGDVREINANTKDILRALRLTKRFNFTENNIRSKIMKHLKQREDWSEELKEEFKLLPEEVKQIEAKKQ